MNEDLAKLLREYTGDDAMRFNGKFILVKVADIIEGLSDPNAVHANMLRGTIAKPSLAQIIHLYGSQALIDEIHIHHGPEFIKPRPASTKIDPEQGFATAGAESRWIEDVDKGVYDEERQKCFARGVIVGAVAMAIGFLIGFNLN